MFLLLGLVGLSSCGYERTAVGKPDVDPVRHPDDIQNGDFLIQGSIGHWTVGDAEEETNTCWLDFSDEDFWKEGNEGRRIQCVNVYLSLKATGSAHTDALYLGDELVQHPFPELDITNGQRTQKFENVKVTCNNPATIAAITEHLRKEGGKVRLSYLDDATLYRARVKFCLEP